MRYFVDVAGRSLVVEVVDTADGERVTVDGRVVAADLAPVGGSAFSLLVDGRSHPLKLESESGELRVSFADAGTSVRVRVENERERLLRDVKQPSSDAQRTVRSVMSGIVARLIVKPGDVVAAGEPLLVIEAMKMENEVRAEAAGRVRAVHVAERARVNLGDPLVTLGPKDD
jgi:glutaconyl-CoA/methylmalonyl-CoA decarboxylase subunit gamma